MAEMVDLLAHLVNVTEEDFNSAMGFTDESALQARFKAAAEEFSRQYRQVRQADGQYYEDHGPESEREFHLFPKLPAELKLLVWKHATWNLPVPKIQALDFDLAYDANAAPVDRTGNGVIACFKPKYNRALAGHRALLMTCVDSRKAFLDSGDYTMLSLTYLVSPAVEDTTKKQKEEPESFMEYVKKANETFDKCDESRNSKEKYEEPTPKIKKNETPKDTSQANKTFVNVVVPVNFAETRFVIDKVEETFAYKSIHPAPPSLEMVFNEAAGLEFMHSIKRLAFCLTKKSLNSDLIFADWFANSPIQNRRHLVPSPYDLGALEELTYVSARAFKRQCCIGHDNIWNLAPTTKVRTFDRTIKGTAPWRAQDMHRMHIDLISKWKQFDRRFNLRWTKAMRQPCTCRR